MEGSVQPAAADGGGSEAGGESLGYAGTYSGQGEADQGAGLYDLSSAPEEVRPFLEAELRKIEGNVTKKFMEHAEFREKLGPLSEVEGLTDLSQEELEGLVAFHKIASDPELFDQWLGEVGGGGNAELDEDAWMEMGIEKGWFDGDEEGGEDGAPDPEQLTQQVLEQLEPQLQQFREFLSQQEQQQAVQEVQSELEQRMTQLVEEHGDALDQEEVIHLSHGYVAQGHEDPLGAAADHYMRIRGSAAGELVDDKLENTDRVLAGGTSDTSPDGFGHDSPDLKKAALARMQS